MDLQRNLHFFPLQILSLQLKENFCQMQIVLAFLFLILFGYHFLSQNLSQENQNLVEINLVLLQLLLTHCQLFDFWKHLATVLNGIEKYLEMVLALIQKTLAMLVHYYVVMGYFQSATPTIFSVNWGPNYIVQAPLGTLSSSISYIINDKGTFNNDVMQQGGIDSTLLMA